MGWKSCIFVVLCFPLSCYVFVLCFFLLFFVMFSPSLFKRLHLQWTNTYKHITTNNNNSKENIKNKHKPTKTTDLQKKKNRNLPARPLEIFICRGGSWAGNHVFLFVLCFPSSVYVLFLFLYVLFSVFA